MRHMRIFILLLFVLELSSCVSDGSSERLILSELKSPVIVVAIGKPSSSCPTPTCSYTESAPIVLKDNSGKIISFDRTANISIAVSQSLHVGDTLK